MDKIKYILFIIFLLIVTIFPIIKKNNFKKINSNSVIIPTILYNGKYFVYEQNLTKLGSFSKLEIFNKKINVYDFYLNNLIDKYKLFSSKGVYVKPLLKGENVKYINEEYNLTTNFAIYNQKSKILRGKRFSVYSNSFKGFGDSFKVDKNRDIFATNIKYFIKVNE